ncbi:retrovirus-related pol polyprotein from transposon TNT 1-94 [Tanacetum coccineum]
MAAVEVPQTLEYRGGQLNVAPVLEVENFTNWKKRFMCHIIGIEPQFENIISNGPYIPMAAGQRKPETQWTPEERKAANLDQRLKSLIMSVLLDDQMNSVINCLTAKSTWDDLILYHEGPSDVKESRVMDLKLCYNTFKFKEGESLTQTFTRYKALMNELDFQDSPDDEEDLRSSQEYMNDLEEEYQTRALLAKSKRFFKKGTQKFSSAKATDQTECHKCGKKSHFAKDCWSKTSVPSYPSPFQPKLLHSSEHKPEPRHTKDFKAKYNKVKAKLALLSSSASALNSSSGKNKGLIAESYDWDEEVSSDENDVTKVKALMALADEERVYVMKLLNMKLPSIVKHKIHVKESELASLFGKLKYEENIINNIYDTNKEKTLVPATPLSTTFFSSFIIHDFKDSPDDEEDTRSSQEYMNDLEEEYQERALLAKSKRHTKDFEAKYNKIKDEEEVSSDENDVTKVKALMALADEERVSVGKESARNELIIKQAKLDLLTMQHVNTKILKENQNLRNELKELTFIIEEWLNSSNKAKRVFVKSSANNSEVSITGSNKPKLFEDEDSTLSNHDTANESSVCSTPHPTLEKLTGAKLVSGPKTIKSILKSKFTFKAKTLNGITINEPSSAPARGNKSSLVSKTNSTPAGKLKNVKMEDDPPLAIVMKELNELKLQISKNKSSYFRNKNSQQARIRRIFLMDMAYWSSE